MSALLVSCEPENGEDNPEPTPEPEYSISISPAELTFGAEGGEQSVTVTSSESWYLDGGSPWCEVSASYGESGDEILIKANPNTDAENSRSAKLVFTCGDKTAELTVNQQKDEIIEFKDPAFLKAILQEDADKNGDKKVSKAEAALVTSLDVSTPIYTDGPSHPQIRVMDEIKYFTALTELDCYRNQLTSLDLSNNTALAYLYCYENQLTSLDLSNNKALRYLSCQSNDIMSLDLSNNTALIDLDCYENQLTSLDLSNNTALIELSCSDNQLTSLDLSNNKALTYLSCGDNQLTSLDVSNNTALTDLYCKNNQLTSLDLSRCSALTNFDCSDNQLTSLDVSNNTALETLYCSYNPLQKLILYKYHIIDAYYMSIIEKTYGDIIEYVE